VNVAAHLQAQADPGGILVSDMVRDQVHRRMNVTLTEFGTLELKNLDEPMRTFRVGTRGVGDAPDHIGSRLTAAASKSNCAPTFLRAESAAVPAGKDSPVAPDRA
jgi:hypothetical protein